MKEMDLQELPPLVYQMLLLSIKGLKAPIIKGIIGHFSYLEEQVKEKYLLKIKVNYKHSFFTCQRDAKISAEQLRHIEGTVILHINFAIKQDQVFLYKG